MLTWKEAMGFLRTLELLVGGGVESGHGLRIAVVGVDVGAVVVTGQAWMTTEQVRGFAAELLSAATRARAW